MVSGFPKGWKLIKNQQKIVSETILSYDAKATPQNVPKSCQHGLKFGLGAGPGAPKIRPNLAGSAAAGGQRLARGLQKEQA